MSTTDELFPLDDDSHTTRQGRMANRVFDALREAIVQLKLRPGNPISEAEVARQLGVSRQPVRESFIKLAEVGLVEIRPQRGTFVMLISIRQVQNVRFVREAIEVAVVRKAALEASPKRIEEFRRILEAQRNAERQGDHIEFLRLDESFHQSLAYSVDSDYAWRVLENLKAQMDRVRHLSMPDATPIDVLVGQHAAIVDAIARHAPDDAEAATRTHLSEILLSLPRLAQAHPELFSD
ncbi:GntR family transcriptional regulator [Youhaiella tibetensis]|uniref:GntR family transcriptional regulator n=1 Tax=Paradevosia tibetensis TaxID=1447062 RepID=A0A5B9DSG9_9HYPH|nr:GntR family transcriptional regulator [Youhaiella tibetensis]QEE22096.1 GntR family transcriptional regulator [Youhaiella tibetensis]